MHSAPPTSLGRHHEDRWLQVAASAIACLLVVYPFATWTNIVGNFSVVDAALLGIFAWILTMPAAAPPLFRMARSGYGTLAMLLVLWLIFSAFFSPDMENSLLSTAQCAVNCLVLIPAACFCLLHLRDPEKFLTRFCIIYAALYFVGFLLVKAGSSALLYDNGTQRYFPVWSEAAAYRQQVLIAGLAIGGYFLGTLTLGRTALWLPAILLMQLGLSSRACVVGMATALAAALLLTRQRIKVGSVVAALIVLCLASLVLLWIIGTAEKPEFLGVRINPRILTKGATDEGRVRAAEVALEGLKDTKTLLVGVGLHSRYRPHHVGAHNPVIQFAYEAGLVAGVLLLMLKLYPIVAFLGHSNRRVKMGLIIYISLFVFEMFSPFAVDRATRMYEGIALGLIWRGAWVPEPESAPEWQDASAPRPAPMPG